jgi:hypothetical protein
LAGWVDLPSMRSTRGEKKGKKKSLKSRFSSHLCVRVGRQEGLFRQRDCET